MTPAPATAPGRRAASSRALRLALWFASGLGLACLLPVLFGLGFSDIARGISAVPTIALLPLIAAQVLVVLAGARKWQIVLRALPEKPVRLPFSLCSTATTLGALVGQVLPIQIVTPAIRGWLARRYEVPLLRSVGGSIYAQMIDLLVLAAAGSASAMVWMLGTATGGGVSLALLASLVALAAMTLAIRPVLTGLSRAATGLARGKLTRTMSRFSSGLAEAARLPVRALRALVFLGLLRYLLLAAMNVGVMCLIVPHADPLLLLAGYPVILLVMSAPVFPGGLGVTEISWAALLVAAGSTAPQAVEAALVLRILSTAAFLVAVPPLLAFGFAGTRRHAS